MAYLADLGSTPLPYLDAIRNLVVKVKYVQRCWRQLAMMWSARRGLHEDQWIREEALILCRLKESHPEGELPDEIPLYYRDLVLAKFMNESKLHHGARVRKYDNMRQAFLRRHRRAAEQKMALALSAGQISIKMAQEDFMRLFMPIEFGKRPARPWYWFALSDAQMEDLILDAAMMMKDDEQNVVRKVLQDVGRWEHGDVAAGKGKIKVTARASAKYSSSVSVTTIPFK